MTNSLPLLLLFLLVPCFHANKDGCKEKDHFHQLDMVESFIESPIVVYGKDLNHTSDGNAKFMVYCSIKANLDIPEHITIKSAVSDDPCAHTKLSIGSEYILTLKQTDLEQRSQTDFRLREPSDENTAAFTPSTENLQTTANLCTVIKSAIKTPDDATQTDKTCPKRTVMEENCISESVTSGARQLGSATIYSVVVGVGLLVLK